MARSWLFRRSTSPLRCLEVMPPVMAPSSAMNSVMPTTSTPNGVEHSTLPFPPRSRASISSSARTRSSSSSARRSLARRSSSSSASSSASGPPMPDRCRKGWITRSPTLACAGRAAPTSPAAAMDSSARRDAAADATAVSSGGPSWGAADARAPLRWGAVGRPPKRAANATGDGADARCAIAVSCAKNNSRRKKQSCQQLQSGLRRQCQALEAW
mmetsp:Transcript_22788/g.58413  ORF Transcript_22788/g.58413 Transcript_22788/m.58413 type:complete len:214 (+) Transcript_22788:90-731(+)